MTILLIDDEPGILGLLGAQLRANSEFRIQNSEFFTANSANAGILLLDHRDAVLCDGLNGDWLKVWAVASKRAIRFALYSGDAVQIVQAAALGIQTFEKPGGTSAAIRWLLGAGDSGPGFRESRAPSRESRVASPGSFDDPRFTNGRRTGCISPNDERGTMNDEQESPQSADATGFPYSEPEEKP